MSEIESLDAFATEILLRIGRFLTDADMAHLSLTNRYFYQVFAETIIYRSTEDKVPRVVKISALEWAIDYGYQTIIERIINKPGFYCDYVDNIQAIHWAAAKGDPAILSLLIAVGYSVLHRQDFKSRTPLHTAASYGHVGAVQLLLDNGAEVDATDTEDKHAFELATEGHWPILQKLIRAAPPGPLKLASLTNEVENRVLSILRILVDHGAHNEIFRHDAFGNTALHRAVMDCAGLDTSMDLSIGTGVLRFLTDRGASLLARNSDGQTPIDLAVITPTGNLTALNFILNLGISPNHKDASGASLLAKCLLCSDDSLELIEHLLKRGASTVDVELVDFFYNAENPSPALFEKILTLLRLHGADYAGTEDDCLTLAAHHGLLNVMKMVFEAGAGIDAAVATKNNARQLTPIRIAIGTRQRDMLSWLVRNGAKMTESQITQAATILGHRGFNYRE